MGPKPSCPHWLRRIRPHLAHNPTEWFRQHPPPSSPRRRSSVLMLFGPDAGGGVDVVLTERAYTLNSHAAQVVFPGGHQDPDDDGPTAAALREAHEEVGLDPASVEVLGELPALYMTPSSNAVTPVLGWWHSPHPIQVMDEAEVRTVVRAPLREVTDPMNRFTVRWGGYRGPGFDVQGLYVWGFTATLLSEVLDLGGVVRPWNEHIERALPGRLAAAYLGEA